MDEGHAAGGSRQLAELIDEFGEQIYFDLHQHAGGLNLVHALDYDSGYSPRQILMLIRQLPLESATVAAMRGGTQFRGWGLDRYLLTQIADSIHENTYATVVVSGASKRKPKKPEPMWRPEEKQAKPKRNAFGTMAASFLRAARMSKPKE